MKKRILAAVALCLLFSLCMSACASTNQSTLQGDCSAYKAPKYRS